MPEDAGKKKYIQDFLKQVSYGEGLVEDVFVDRAIRRPGSEGEGSSALPLSSAEPESISKITDLLQDDLKHCFSGSFTFRIVSASMGSGKTSLLSYLHELINTDRTYRNRCIVSSFELSEIAATGGDLPFEKILPLYMLAETFYNLLQSSSVSIANEAKNVLKSHNLPTDEWNSLQGTFDCDIEVFRSQFIDTFKKKSITFINQIFMVIDRISKIESECVFVYLVDELDNLHRCKVEKTATFIRMLVKKAFLKKKIRLLFYIAGRQESASDLFEVDKVLEDHVRGHVINLSKGSKSELLGIKEQVLNRIKGAFWRFQDFDKAWREIEQIGFDPTLSMREFCKTYVAELRIICAKYFSEAPEQQFEGNARELIESQCQQRWGKFLGQKAYRLHSNNTTVHLTHAFDCYAELHHNERCVARCFGEAKNYDLLKSHFDTFKQWLDDENYNAHETPPELAFMIAPGCSPLLERKLGIANISFLQAEKVRPVQPSNSPQPEPDATSRVLKAIADNWGNAKKKQRSSFLPKIAEEASVSEKRIEEIIDGSKQYALGEKWVTCND
jgi:hypothetical protein